MKNFSKIFVGFGIILLMSTSCEDEIVEPVEVEQKLPEKSELTLTRQNPKLPESDLTEKETLQKPDRKQQRLKACAGHSVCNIKRQEEMHLPHLKKE